MRRLVLCGLTAAIGIGSTGCTAWRVRNVPPAQLVADPKVEVIRVRTQRDSTPLFVFQPRMQGDTLTGHPSPTAIQRLSIATGDIAELATRYKHIGKTLLAAMAVGGGILIYGLLQSLNGSTP